MENLKKVIKPFKLSKGGTGKKINYHWRLLIPKEYWEDMQLEEGDFIEISINDKKIIEIKKIEIK